MMNYRVKVIFNVVIIVLGVLTLGSGTLDSLFSDGYSGKVLGTGYVDQCLTLLVCVAALVVCSFQIYAIKKNKRKLFVTVTIYLVILIYIEAIVGLSLLRVYYSKPLKFLPTYQEQLLQYNITDEITSAIDEIQSSELCCGVLGYGDYEGFNYVPPSCMKPFLGVQYPETIPFDFPGIERKVNSKGCLIITVSNLQKNFGLMGGLIFTIIGLQALSLYFSIQLYPIMENDIGFAAH